MCISGPTFWFFRAWQRSALAEDVNLAHHLHVVDLPSSDLKEQLLTFIGEDLAEKVAADAAVIFPPGNA